MHFHDGVVGGGKMWWVGKTVKLLLLVGEIHCWGDGLDGGLGDVGKRWCLARILLMMGWSCAEVNPALM